MLKECVICGKEFKAKGTAVACSDECKLKRRRQTQRNHALKTGKFTLKKKVCKVCGKEFETYRGKQVCCSSECSGENYKQNIIDYEEKNRSLINEKRMKYYYEKERQEYKECTCVVCGKQFTTEHKRKYCSKECEKERRRTNRVNKEGK